MAGKRRFEVSHTPKTSEITHPELNPVGQINSVMDRRRNIGAGHGGPKRGRGGVAVRSRLSADWQTPRLASPFHTGGRPLGKPKKKEIQALK